jgi:SAM-dependent methyltransferase
MTTGFYDAAFYDRADQSATAARAIVPILRSFLEIGSVLDVGCARGAWLSVWAETGSADVMGIDGGSFGPDQLAIDPGRFATTDLSAPFRLGRRFDLVQCLEVAEHLPLTRAESLVADLAAHSDVVFFSAAPPGQGGEHHINERPYEFWRGLFADQGYVAIDCLRPAIRHQTAIPFWYRYNALVYVKSGAIGTLSEAARSRQLARNVNIPDMAPPGFRIRKMVLRALPSGLIDVLARINTKLS